MRLKQFSGKLLLIPVAVGTLLCSCMEPTDEKNTLTVDPESSFTYDINGNVSFFDSTLEEDKDNDEKEFKKKITINFDGAAKPTIEPAETEGVEIDNSEKGEAHLIIKSSEKINYVLKGESANGSLLIFSQKKFKLTLDDLKLSNDAGVPAISSQTKKRCFIESIGTSTVKDAQSYSLPEAYKIKDANGEYVLKDDGKSIACYDAKGAIFSEGEIIFCGNGTLNVEGRNKHAIASDQYVRLLSGTVNVTGSKKDGIHANDSVFINGGTINITSNANGIQCEKGFVYINGGTTNITSGKTGIIADYKDFSEKSSLLEQPFVLIEKGTVDIKTSELKGHGIESGSHLLIVGGEVTIATKGNSAKGLKSGTNSDSTVKGDIVIAKTAKVNITVSGSSNAAVAVKSEAGIYLRGGLLEAVADGSGGMGLSASENVVISGGDNKVYAAGYFLNTTEATINTGAKLLAVGSMCGVTSFKDCTQKYMSGEIDSEIAAGKQYEVDGVTDEFVTNLTPLAMLFTKNGLSDKVSIKIDGADRSDNFELK